MYAFYGRGPMICHVRVRVEDAHKSLPLSSSYTKEGLRRHVGEPLRNRGELFDSLHKQSAPKNTGSEEVVAPTWKWRPNRITFHEGAPNEFPCPKPSRCVHVHCPGPISGSGRKTAPVYGSDVGRTSLLSLGSIRGLGLTPIDLIVGPRCSAESTCVPHPYSFGSRSLPLRHMNSRRRGL